MSFTVKVKSTYSTGQNAELELYIDGNLVDSTQRVINANSEKTFNLHWFARQGEHSYTIKAYSIVGREKFTEDAKRGRVSVASPNQQFAIKLEAFPKELEGGEVFFTVRVWNFENQAISLSGFVEDGDGAVVKKIDGFEGRVPANAQNYTLTAFSLDVYGVGNHTYRLFLDNTDGKPNGKGEEHWSGVRVEVKPMNGEELEQVGFECDDPEFNWNGIEYKATLVCRAFVYNPTQENIYLNSGGVKEWHVDN